MAQILIPTINMITVAFTFWDSHDYVDECITVGDFQFFFKKLEGDEVTFSLLVLRRYSSKELYNFDSVLWDKNHSEQTSRVATRIYHKLKGGLSNGKKRNA